MLGPGLRQELPSKNNKGFKLVFKTSQQSTILPKSSQFPNLGNYLKTCEHNTGHAERSAGCVLPVGKLAASSPRARHGPGRATSSPARCACARSLQQSATSGMESTLSKDPCEKAPLHKQLAHRHKFSASDPSSGKLWQREVFKHRNYQPKNDD